MTGQRLSAFALAAALASGLPAAAQAANARTTLVDLGGSRAYVRSDAAASLATVVLFVRAGLDRQTAGQNGLAALVAESVLHTPLDGVPLTDAVDAKGGSIAIAVSAQYVRFSLEAPPDALPAVAALVARALAAPSFEPAVLTAARAKLGQRIADDEADPRMVGLGMLRASYYRDGAGLPALGTPAGLSALAPQDARAFFTRWYLRGDAYVTAVGSTGENAAAVSRTLVAALPAGSTAQPPIATHAYTAQPKRIVTHRDVFAPYVVLGFAAPSLGDKDFAAALVMRSILGDVFQRVGATTLPPAFRAVGAMYGYDVDPAQFALWINGSRIDPSTGLATVDAVLSGAAKKALAPAVLARYKETARGEWSLESLSLDERAFAIGNAVALGLDADAADGVTAAIGRVTASDLQRVAKKYFLRYDVALVLPRSGS